MDETTHTKKNSGEGDGFHRGLVFFCFVEGSSEPPLFSLNVVRDVGEARVRRSALNVKRKALVALWSLIDVQVQV